MWLWECRGPVNIRLFGASDEANERSPPQALSRRESVRSAGSTDL